MLQGFSLGGEYTGSITYVVEAAPADRRGRQGSLPAAGAQVGIVAGALTAALVQARLTPEAMQSWGWRLPFLLAGAMALLALWLRRGLPEVPLQRDPHDQRGLAALVRSLRREAPRLRQVLAILAFEKVSFYLVFVFWVQRAISLHPAGGAACRCF